MPVTVTAATLASDILTQLGEDFTIPAVDFNDPKFAVPTEANSQFGSGNSPEPISPEALTDGTVGGAGAFDKIMSSTKAHLKEQYEKGVLTGDQYSKAYVELTTAAMSAGVQLVLGKDNAYWQSKLIQMQGRRAEIEAVTAMIQLEITKAELAAKTSQAKLVNAQYVFTLVQTAREDANYQLTHKQIALTESQKLNVDKEIAISDYKLDNLMPQELATLTQQVQVLFAQELMVKEQAEAQRGQTMDIRSDGITPISGSIAKQKDLYTQQIDSYIKDGDLKVAKMFTDGWSIQKTLNEDIPPPNQFTQANIDSLLVTLRGNHNL